jgi:mono/diheme cytochrome c family protein
VGAATFAGAGAAAGDSEPAAQRGRAVFEARCASCHGSAGRGDGPALGAAPIRPPDFTDCRFAAREPDADFLAVAHRGGPARGFSPVMPAQGAVLPEEALRDAIAYVRTFCTDDRWPRGELNLPRPLLTEKAFPEDEAVWTTRANLEDEDRAQEETQLRAALGWSHAQDRLGRVWTPMLEAIWTTVYDEPVHHEVDLVPQVQVTLGRRQHVRLDVGLRIPADESSRRPTELAVYLLWDWFDGGLLEGW